MSRFWTHVHSGANNLLSQCPSVRINQCDSDRFPWNLILGTSVRNL